MRIINISCVLLLLFSFKSYSETAVIKGLEPSPEGSPDCPSGETNPTPEATNVRSKNPETESLNDVAEPQLPRDPKEHVKRCAIPDTVGSPGPNTILSLVRRDLTERRIQLCEGCKNGKLCKDHNVCAQCRTFCNTIPTTTTTTTTTALPLPDNENNMETTRPEEKSATAEITPDSKIHPDDQNLVVGARFKGGDDKITVPRYYSLGSVKSGPVMNLFQKIFNIPEGFQKFIVLGKMRGSEKKQNVDDIVIIDLAQIFGSDKKTKVTVHKFESLHQPSVNLVNHLNKKLEEMMRERQQEKGDSPLSMDEIGTMIDEAMRQVSNSVGSAQEETETATRCSLDEAVEDLLDVMPTSLQRSKVTPHSEEKSHTQQFEESSGEEIKNPSVIQNNFDLVGNTLEDGNINQTTPDVEGFVNDNEEGRPIVITELESNSTVPLQDAKKGTGPKEESSARSATQNQNIKKPPGPGDEGYVDDNEEGRPIVVTELKSNSTVPLQDAKKGTGTKERVSDQELPILSLSNDAGQPPVSENQINEPNLQGRANADNNDATGESAPQDLEQNVIKIVQDSLRAVSDGRNMFQDSDIPRESVGQENPIEQGGPPLVLAEEMLTPNEANSKNMMHQSQTQPKDVMLQAEENVQPASFVTNLEGNTVSEVPTRPTKPTIPPVIRKNTVAPLTHLSYDDHDDFTPEIPEVPSNIVQMEPSNVELRSQFSGGESPPEKPGYFGALIPSKDLPSGVEDPRMKKMLYVGDNIKLPLKLFQDRDGVMKLRVDTEALCNCKNQNCTRKHVDERLRTETENSEEAPALPDLQVRFGRDNHRVDLMNSFVDTLNDHNENSDVYKRSARIDSDAETMKTAPDINLEDDKMELENEILKLNEDIESYNEANKDLLNKGTVALFKDVEKTKDVDRMITLASNLLSWMKDFATKHLDS